MELYEAIKKLVNQFGKDIITERRFIYMIADYYSFRDNPAEKHVISVIVNDGYAQKLLNISSQEDRSIIESQMSNSVCRNYGFREDIVFNVIRAIEEGIGLPHDKSQKKTISDIEENKSEMTLSLSTSKPLSAYECLLTEEYVVSLYSTLFDRYAHIDAQRIQEKLNIKDEEVFTLIHFLEKIKALRYNHYSQDYDICVFSPGALRKHYKEWKAEKIANSKPHLFSLQELKEGLMHLFKLKFTNVKLLAKNLKTDEHKAAVVFQELKRTKIINDKGSLVTYLDASTIAKKVWRKC